MFFSQQTDDDVAPLELDEAELGGEEVCDEKNIFQSRKKVKEDRPGKEHMESG